MNWRIMGIFLALLASVLGIFVIVSNSTPEDAGAELKTLFLFAIFVALWSGMTLIVYFIRKKFAKGNFAFDQILNKSFIAGFIFAFLLMAVVLVRKLM